MGKNLQFHSLGQFDNATINVSSEAGYKTNLVDYKYTTKWSSLLSNDTVTETIEFDLGAGVTASVQYAMLLNMNGKSGKVEYWDGAAYVAFGAAWSGNANSDLVIDNGAEVVTQKVKISITTTIIANREKTMGLAIFTTLLHELNENIPDASISSVPAMKGTNNKRGLINITRFDEPIRTVSVTLDNLRNATDLAVINELDRARVSFVLVLCGDTEYTTYGFGFKDIRRFVISNVIRHKLESVIVEVGTNINLEMDESLK